MEDWDSLFEKARRTFQNSNIGADVKFSFENGRNVHIFANGTQFRIIPDSTVPAKSELTMTYEDACRLINREMSPQRALATFRLKIKGDFSVVWKVASILGQPLPPLA